MTTEQIVRKAVTRRDAAVMYGVSEDVIRAARDANLLHPKAMSRRSDGQVTKELYSVAELEQWFDGLEDA